MTDPRTCLDLFSGLGGFSAAFADSDAWDVVTVDLDPDDRFDPDIRADVMDLRPADLPDADVVLASPPCTAFTQCSGRTHLNETGAPVSEFGRESIALAHHTIGLIRSIHPDYYVVENPAGRLHRELGEPDALIWWCQYGADVAKPTHLWGKLPYAFEPKTCSNGDKGCGHELAPRGSDSGTQKSGKSAAERAKIPYGLSDAILKAVEDAYANPPPEQATVDAFGGADD